MNETELRLADGKTIKAREGTAFADLAKHLGIPAERLAAVRSDNEILPLSARLAVSKTLEPVPLDSHEGAAIHRHTFSFLVAAAAVLSFPGRSLRAGHALGNAYYYSFHGGNTPSSTELAEILRTIDNFVARDVVIERRELPYNEAVEIFRSSGQEDTAELLEQTAGKTVYVNVLDEYYGLYTCPLLPRTGLVQNYDIISYHDGFLARYPVYENGELVLNPYNDLPGIFSVYSESKKWGRIARVNAVNKLNCMVSNGKVREFTAMVEGYTEKRFSRIADRIYDRRGEIKILLIAGPSSSGKTTTAKRVGLQLMMMGIEPVMVSLDDYYLHPDKCPRDEKGNPDFECLEALDVPFLNEQLLKIISGEEVTLPTFDFKTCLRGEGKKVRLSRRMMLVLEGIHGLNDKLTESVPRNGKFKLYVSALTQLNLDGHNRISTTDNRLLRRMVRDNRFRGIDAGRTLKMWPDVQRGAEKHVFTFQNEADAVFNSSLDYEIAVLKTYAEPLLRSVHPDAAEYSEAVRILGLLRRFYPIPSDFVPPQSILREFIGGSSFKY